MTEIWETTDNMFHNRPNDPYVIMYAQDIDMKWIQTPDELGGERINVAKKYYQPCILCRKHSPMTYELENNLLCCYCTTKKTFAWCKKDDIINKSETEGKKEP